MIICLHCSEQNDDGDLYCANCGNPLTHDKVTVKTPEVIFVPEQPQEQPQQEERVLIKFDDLPKYEQKDLVHEFRNGFPKYDGKLKKIVACQILSFVLMIVGVFLSFLNMAIYFNEFLDDAVTYAVLGVSIAIYVCGILFARIKVNNNIRKTFALWLRECKNVEYKITIKENDEITDGAAVNAEDMTIIEEYKKAQATDNVN